MRFRPLRDPAIELGHPGEMPALPISYDGQQDPTLQTRLEAFIYQARAYQQRNGDGGDGVSRPLSEPATS